jgi:hypothetical protein
MKIEINFFRISFPPGNLPFWTRRLAANEKLRYGERFWGLRGEKRDENNPLAMLVEGAPNAEYVKRDEDPMKVNPFLIKVALEASLRKKLRKIDYVVNIEKTTTSFFDKGRKYQGAPDFLTVLRGFECRADTIEEQQDLIYGFFISTRSRVTFSKSLQDPIMAKLSADRSVSVQDGTEAYHGRLVKIDPASSKATIAIGSKSKEFAVSQVFLQGNSSNITAYCKMTRRQSEARKAILAGQFANDRLGIGGTKNPQWLRNQAENICIWMDKLSEQDVVPVEWAFDSPVLRLETRPSQIQPRAVQ